jgi:hypothetical protein
MFCDPMLLANVKRQDLLDEADRERLAAQVHRPRSEVRRELALACYRLADWIDNPKRYLQRSESGRVDWARVR